MNLSNQLKLYKKEIIAFWIIALLFCFSNYIGFKKYLEFEHLKKEKNFLIEKNRLLSNNLNKFKKMETFKIKETIFRQKIPYNKEAKKIINCLYKGNIVFIKNFKIKNTCQRNSCYKILEIYGKKISIDN